MTIYLRDRARKTYYAGDQAWTSCRTQALKVDSLDHALAVCSRDLLLGIEALMVSDVVEGEAPVPLLPGPLHRVETPTRASGSFF